MRPGLRQIALSAMTALSALSAQAATYQFTGPLYSSVANFMPPCSAGNCTNYTAAMRVTGHFTTVAPLAANLVGTNVLAQVTSYSFSDGVHTITSTDPGARLSMFEVWTNAGGDMTSSQIGVWRWQDNLAGPHAVGDRIDQITATNVGATVDNNFQCDSVGVNALGIADSCTSTFTQATATSEAIYGGGTWASAPDIAINDVSGPEGNAGTTNFNFTVSLSFVPTAPVSVDWTTVDNGATSGSDYTADSGTLTWATGDGSSRTVTIQVLGDTNFEGNEGFTVNLNNASGAGISDALGAGTIINDDVAPPDLTLTNTDSAASTAPGATVVYTLICANSAAQAASGVTITETVPANTTFNAGASTAGWTCLPDVNAGSTCTYTVGNLGAGGWGSAAFAVTVASPLSEAVTLISNSASCADDGSHGADPTPANNAAIDTDTVVHPQVPPAMGNVPDQTGTVGTPYSLTIATWVTTTNGDPITGYAIASGTLPPGLTLNPATGVITGAPTVAGTHDITVTASDNDGASTADAVRFIISAPVGIPTLSKWAMITLSGILALVALGGRRWRT